MVPTLLSLSLLLLFCCIHSAPPFEEKWFTQTLDHFNFETSPATFQQRYLLTKQFWKETAGEKGPIFFYTGNEGDITSFYENSGFVFELAAEMGAAVVFGEHRYYGKTLPFGDSSWDRGKIGFLTVEQALADYVELVSFLKHDLQAEDSPVVAFGGSYGGMLSAWIRIKYPYVFDAALAASAPILMASGMDPHPSYFETVTNDFQKANPSCPAVVRQAFAKLLHLASQGTNGLKQITNDMKLCSPLTSDQVNHLILWVVNSYGNLAMMDYPYPTNFLAPLPAFPVKAACQTLLTYASNGQFLQGLAQSAGLAYNGTSTRSRQSDPLTCFNISAEFIECADQTGCGTGGDGKSWDYQACGEIIYFPNTNNVTDMFPPRNWGPANLTRHCQDTWGITPRYGWTAKSFGAEKITQSSRIIFSNGDLDPWSGGGFLTSLSDSLIAISVENGAHHLDLRGSNPQDPDSVIQVREKEATLISTWIAEIRKEKQKRKATKVSSVITL